MDEAAKRLGRVGEKMAWIDEAASDSAGEGAVRTSARRRVEW